MNNTKGKRQHLPQLHDIGLCRQVYELAGSGVFEWSEIASIVGISKTQAFRWYAKPELYSPYIDEVAMSRALLEPSVYANLSNYERHAFWLRVKLMIADENPIGNTRKTGKELAMEIAGMNAVAFEEFLVKRIPRSPLATGAF